jgi:hypothetical protein
MENELPSHLKDIHERFLDHYIKGGLAAAELMVKDLAAEAEGIKVFAGGAEEVKKEAIASQELMSGEEIVGVSIMTEEIMHDTIQAVSCHSFALVLLSIFKA